MNHLEWVFVGRQESFIVAPTFDEGETARFARRVCQSVDDILRRKKIQPIRKQKKEREREREK